MALNWLQNLSLQGWKHFLTEGVSCLGSRLPVPNAPSRQMCALMRGRGRVTVVLSHDMGGGATQYLEAESTRLADGGDMLIVTPSVWPGLLRLDWRGEGRKLGTCLLPSLGALRSLHGRCSRIIVNELVHWEAYYGEPVSVEVLQRVIDAVLALRTRLSCDMDYRVHDYFCICPRFTLTAHDGHYCRSELTGSRCAECLQERQFVELKLASGIDRAEWCAQFRRLLEACTEIRTFSEDTRRRMQSVFGGLSFTMVPHAQILPFRQNPKFKSNGKAIGVFGNVFAFKGVEEVLALADYLMKSVSDAVRIVVVGRLSTSRRSVPPNLKVLGRYNPKDLPDIVEREGIGVAFFSSVWPETFSYVVGELIALGLPVACYDLGAPADRVRDYVRGAIIPEMTPESTWRTLSGLALLNVAEKEGEGN